MATTLPLGESFFPGAPDNGQPRRIWHKSAPKALRAAGAVDSDELWLAWAEHLRRRTSPKPLAALIPGKRASLLWALPSDADRPATRGLIDLLDRLAGKGRPQKDIPERLVEWLAAADQEVDHTARAIETLAWCQALPALGQVCEGKLWWELVAHLLHTAEQAAGIDNNERPLLRHLLAGELPLTLAYQLPEIKRARRLARPAGRSLSQDLCDLTDGMGVPQAEHLDRFRPLLACWTRCYVLGQHLPDGALSEQAEIQLQWAVRVMLHLTRCDGRQMLCPTSDGAWSADLFRAALAADVDPEDHRIAALVLPSGKKLADVRGKLSKWKARWEQTDEAAFDSEWAEVNVMRPGWTRGGPQVAVAYQGGQFRCELAIERDVVWSGAWQFDLTADGQPIEPAGPWEQVAVNSDEDADYAEWEIALTSGVRIQRQLVLGRSDAFLYLADAILAPGKERLHYRLTLPLDENIVFGPLEETRDALLSGRKPRAVVMPLALGEWRSDGLPGSLTADERGLHLEQSGYGSALYCLLWFDLKRRRFTRPMTWRQLHVAQDRRHLKRDEAVGYRVQVGNRQWLIYRSLVEPANRTVLGHNLTEEFLLGRFLPPDGEVRPIVEVDPNEE